MYHPVIMPPADGDVKAAARRTRPSTSAGRRLRAARRTSGRRRGRPARRGRLTRAAASVARARAPGVFSPSNGRRASRRHPRPARPESQSARHPGAGRLRPDVAAPRSTRPSQRHAAARGAGRSAGSPTTRASSWTGSRRAAGEGFGAHRVQSRRAHALLDGAARRGGLGGACRWWRCTSPISMAARSSGATR